MFIQLQYNNVTPYNYATLSFVHSVTMRAHTHVIAYTFALAHTQLHTRTHAHTHTRSLQLHFFTNCNS